MMMKCLNWKVIAALAAVGLGIWALAPGVAAAALPLLVLVACPLSMVVMMRAMGMGGKASCDTKASPKESDDLAALRSEVAALRAEREAR